MPLAGERLRTIARMLRDASGPVKSQLPPTAARDRCWHGRRRDGSMRRTIGGNAMQDDRPGAAEIERRCVIRFGELDGRRSTYRPADMQLSRYERERYSVVGRPAEGTVAGKRLGEATGFSVVYLKCEPGKGVGLHAHATPEVFIPMSGRWAVTLEGGERLELGPWDVISVPPDLMHGLVNLADEPAFVMAINPGHGGAPIRFAPALLAELREHGAVAAAEEVPGAPAPG